LDQGPNRKVLRGRDDQQEVNPTSCDEKHADLLVRLFSMVALDPADVRGDRNATDARSKVDQGPLGDPETVD
jgi:hypothetical protein